MFEIRVCPISHHIALQEPHASLAEPREQDTLYRVFEIRVCPSSHHIARQEPHACLTEHRLKQGKLYRVFEIFLCLSFQLISCRDRTLACPNLESNKTHYIGCLKFAYFRVPIISLAMNRALAENRTLAWPNLESNKTHYTGCLKFAYVRVPIISFAKNRTLAWPNLDRNKLNYTWCLKFSYVWVSSSSLAENRHFFYSFAKAPQKYFQLEKQILFCLVPLRVVLYVISPVTSSIFVCTFYFFPFSAFPRRL